MTSDVFHCSHINTTCQSGRRGDVPQNNAVSLAVTQLSKRRCAIQLRVEVIEAMSVFIRWRGDERWIFVCGHCEDRWQRPQRHRIEEVMVEPDSHLVVEEPDGRRTIAIVNRKYTTNHLPKRGCRNPKRTARARSACTPVPDSRVDLVLGVTKSVFVTNSSAT